MNLREVKNWVNSLPEEFDEFEVVNAEVGDIDKEYHYRLDKPIDVLNVDEETKEILFINTLKGKPVESDVEETKVFLIDIDGTVSEDIKNEESHLYPDAEVLDGALEIINGWYEKGHKINFFTARESKDRVVTETWLEKHGFKYDSLVMDKPRIKDGESYHWVDNRKIKGTTFNGNWTNLIKSNTNIEVFDD